MNPNKFNDAKERLIISAQRVAGNYLLSKYGSAHILGEPKVDLTSTIDQDSSEITFNGTITVSAAGVLSNVDVGMTVNQNEIEVDSETSVQSKIESAVNAAAEHSDKVVASLDGFKLNDDGTKYLKVSHKDLQDANLGIVGKLEYSKSPNKSELLQSIVKDAMLETPISFTGEFKEPTIEAAKKNCEVCGEPTHSSKDLCSACEPEMKDSSKKEASLAEPVAKKSSWLTAELLKRADDEGDELIEDECDTCKNAQSSCKCAEVVVPTVSITADSPLARSTDTLAQASQSEEQSGLEAQAKVEHEAANALMALLQGQGYGSAKIVESSRSADGIDFMAAIDDAGSVKAVSIPVTIKEGKVILPKKSLVATLISKGLDVKAKLAEQFDFDVLEKLAAIDEKIAYEANEVVSILNDKTVEKVAAGEKQPFFDSDDSTMTVQKHLLPNHEDYKLGDKLSDGVDQYEIVTQDGQQNSKGEGDSSLWTLKKCQNPERDDKEVKNKIPS